MLSNVQTNLIKFFMINLQINYFNLIKYLMEKKMNLITGLFKDQDSAEDAYKKQMKWDMQTMK